MQTLVRNDTYDNLTQPANHKNLFLPIVQITDVERRTEGGFNRGQLTVEGFGDDVGRVLHVLFQNENLVAKETNKDGSTQVWFWLLQRLWWS